MAVLDLMGGQVVHARRGRRDAYQPLRSRLFAGHEPASAAAALAQFHAFAALYIADLDAILGRGDNLPAISRIRAALPHLPLWLDAGITHGGPLARWKGAGIDTIVIGSETLADAHSLHLLAAEDDVVLSLDFRGANFLGPPGLLACPACWPARLIAMNLARVGSGEGPDLALLAQLRRSKAGTRLFLAGGVRSRADLEAARDAGAAGVLLASALHDGSLGGADLEALG